jgi:hypothetical protein
MTTYTWDCDTLVGRIEGTWFPRSYAWEIDQQGLTTHTGRNFIRSNKNSANERIKSSKRRTNQPNTRRRLARQWKHPTWIPTVRNKESVPSAYKWSERTYSDTNAQAYPMHRRKWAPSIYEHSDRQQDCRETRRKESGFCPSRRIVFPKVKTWTKSNTPQADNITCIISPGRN